ncbi:DUF2024 family protein [Winogradskyella sp. 3972H.M.0a.05]|uniref:DUF2024 family protein n=1 Tax=Winogradskyella sp. 3972H.M.0a.05 TaxID=2950277 RepID=UPI003398E642
MKVAVWDTYVQRIDGKTMHFDILVPDNITDEKTIFGFGESYLNEKPIETKGITINQCTFCHIEKASEEIENSIKRHGFHIIEMEHCN